MRKPLILITVFIVSLFIGCSEQSSRPNDLLNAVLWMQQSSEYEASALQAYKIAQNLLDKALADKNWTAALEQTGDYAQLPPAVILDVDETVLDNSPFEANLILNNASFSNTLWDKWCNEARAEAVPGAVEFCNYAAEKGVTVFYLTNRRQHLTEATRRNLQKAGFPLSDKTETVITRTDTGDKGPRRHKIAENYRILLLIGDNNGDFASGFTKAPSAQRHKMVKDYRDYWGTKWIVLPNPSYGDWESALYEYNYKLPETDKRALKLKKLRL
ncbi:MAG TPA: 5'-nucleotidase, lipoprotein e(P4) family [Caldithrix abyssi]|uniref:5'-nucleotidase, lipoprotein e(P4) family n=1 Tax=Caldithrix abyssi TaxID=187145 RepID=A0A7V4WW26_CALAY|nr:5'-nucleotidase, lipoprotein e(P4) family [Caldithrix abyssi]